MSDFAELAVVSFFGTTGFLGVYYIGRVANAFGDPVITGFIGNHPIQITDRSLILYNRFLISAFGEVAFGAVLALASMLMGDLVDHEGTKLLANLLAFLAAFVSITWVIHAVYMVLRCRSILRQAEAD